MVNELSQYDMNIAFIFYNFAQVLLPSMKLNLQYLRLFESMYRAWYIEHGISILLKNPFVSWFGLLSQYDASIVFKKTFGMIMQLTCKFQIICYRAQRIFWIPYKGYCMCIEYF
jgi:hypothetical protein